MRDRFQRFYELRFNGNFISMAKKLSFELNNILGNDLKEVESVKNWVDTFNSANEFIEDGFSIRFNSIFIHGFNHSERGSHPSGVEFDFLDNSSSKRELGDVIFISSFYENNKKFLEKISINQVKWGDIKKTTSSWKIDKEQLYLMSRFPRFFGVNGSMIPNCDFNIEDYSKGLGSYGLMTKENFIYVSAKDIQQIIGGGKSINLNDLKNCQRKRYRSDIIWHDFFDILRLSETYCGDTYEFVTEYLRGNIGEIIDSEFRKNSEAKRLLDYTLSSIRNFSQQTSNQEMINFLSNYGTFGYNDNLMNDKIDLNGTLGIIQMRINLDEESFKE